MLMDTRLRAVTHRPLNGLAASTRREAVEQIMRLTHLLAPPDRALVEGIYERGVRASALARAMGHSPKLVHARLRRAMHRLSSPLFRFVAANRTAWPQITRAVGEAIVLRGQTQRATAIGLGLTAHQLRRELERIRIAFELSRAQAGAQASVRPTEAVSGKAAGAVR